MRQVEIWGALCGMGLLVLPGMCAAADVAEHVTHGRFEKISVLQPQGEPQRVIIWLAGSGNSRLRRQQAEALRADGAMVALVDTVHLNQVLRKIGGSCVFSAGDIENLSRYLQAFYHVPTYRLPLLMGDGEGSALAYALAAQAPEHTLAGVLTDGLCPAALANHAVCGAGVVKDKVQLTPVSLPVPWLNATSLNARCHADAEEAFLARVPQARALKRSAQGDVLPALRTAAHSLGEQKGVALPPPPADLEGLPVVEVPSKGVGNDTFAIFVSGDGGWAGLDKEVADALAQAGIPVVGLDSLRYFWTERTPEGFAGDLDRIARFYAHRWQRQRVVLIGFSQGADVLPAAVNHLPRQTRQSLRMIALLSVGKLADYEFHVGNWLGPDDEGLPIAPEIQHLPAGRVACIYGEDDDDALCPSLSPQAVSLIRLPGDHHFKGDYDALAKTILGQLQRTAQ